MYEEGIDGPIQMLALDCQSFTSGDWVMFNLVFALTALIAASVHVAVSAKRHSSRVAVVETYSAGP